MNTNCELHKLSSTIFLTVHSFLYLVLMLSSAYLGFPSWGPISKSYIWNTRNTAVLRTSSLQMSILTRHQRVHRAWHRYTFWNKANTSSRRYFSMSDERWAVRRNFRFDDRQRVLKTEAQHMSVILTTMKMYILFDTLHKSNSHCK